MTAVHAEQLVDGYISRLELELLDVPPERRREIVDDIRNHIADERSALIGETDADLLNLLDRLGDPAEIAAAGRDGQSGPPAPSTNRVGWVEVLALILTPFIWPAGVVLLWLSSSWTTKQKLIGTFIPPGGYPGILFALQLSLLMNVHAGSGCGTSFDDQGQVISTTCAPAWEQTVLTIAIMSVFLVVLLLPVMVGIYLATRLRSRAPS